MSNLLVQMNDVVNTELMEYYQEEPPKYLLVLDQNTTIPVHQKPNWVRRTFIRLVFGWEYVSVDDAKPTKQMLYG